MLYGNFPIKILEHTHVSRQTRLNDTVGRIHEQF